jgi:hypothetical protein
MVWIVHLNHDTWNDKISLWLTFVNRLKQLSNPYNMKKMCVAQVVIGHYKNHGVLPVVSSTIWFWNMVLQCTVELSNLL